MSKNKKYAILLGGPNHLQILPLNPEKHINVLHIPQPNAPPQLALNQANCLQKFIPVSRVEYVYEGQVELQETREKYAIYNFSGYC